MKGLRNLIWTQNLLFWTGLGGLIGAIVAGLERMPSESRYGYGGLSTGLAVFAGLCFLTAAVLEIAKRMPPRE